MKLKELIKEEYFDTLKLSYYKKDQNHNTYDVFVNPSKKELGETVRDRNSNALRYIIDLKNKKLYVFSFNLLHSMVAKKLKILYGMADSDEAIFGVGTFVNGKLNTGRKGALRAIKENEWLRKYFE